MTFLVAVMFAMSAAIRCPAEEELSLPKVKHLIDTHIHLYDTRRDVYRVDKEDRVPWPPVVDAILHKPHLPAEYHRVAGPSGVTGVVIVEASPRVDDNDWVLELTERDDLFVGLVGNLDMFQKSFPSQLDRLRKNPRFLGVRLHLMRKRGVAENVDLVSNLRYLAAADLTLDVLMNGEGVETINEVAKLADLVPDLRMVVNHVLGFNINGELPDATWTDAVRNLSQRENVRVKVSGLYQRSTQQPASQKIAYYEGLLDVLWEHFGADRLIYGSNWPCTKKSGDYTSFVRLVNRYFRGKGQAASEKFFWMNAASAYRLSIR